MDLAAVGLAVGLVLTFVVLATVSGAVLLRLLKDRRLGRFVSADDGHATPVTLRSERLRLSGRPDELRRHRDGSLVPVEFKSRERPAHGPADSHVVQVEAYCLLIEEETGAPPPFGVLRYRAGAEVRVPWNDAARTEVGRLIGEVREPYDGRASPSPRKCARCRWYDGCDVRAN